MNTYSDNGAATMTPGTRKPTTGAVAGFIDACVGSAGRAKHGACLWFPCRVGCVRSVAGYRFSSRLTSQTATRQRIFMTESRCALVNDACDAALVSVMIAD